MKSYTHFTLNERVCLQEFLNSGKSFREIAKLMGRNVSSISREVNRNKSKHSNPKNSGNKYLYHSWRAQILYIQRRREKTYREAIPKGSEQFNYVIEKLNAFWSPEEIANKWKLTHPNSKSFCVSSVYRYIKCKKLPKITAKEHLRRRGRRKCYKTSNFNTIHPDRIIPEWPIEIAKRLRIGDWEGDTVYGGVGKGLLVTLVDRKTRFLIAGIIKTRSATETRKAVERLLSGLPVHSISFDNGSEFSEFKEIEKNLNTEVYFAEPHKPWQRGTNENTNDILRFFFPKGYNFHELDEDTFNAIVASINNRPRKCLNWSSPFEEFFSVALA